MLVPAFEKYYFLQSIGWGIVNSFWQACILWLLYKLIEVGGNKNLSALFKHQLSLLFLGASFVWFVNTVFQHYFYLTDLSQYYNRLLNFEWAGFSEQINLALQLLSIGYFVLLLLQLIKFIKSFTGLHYIKTNALQKAAVDIRVFTNQTALLLGIKKNISIWFSNNVDVPSVIGWIKPIILLPVTALNQLTTEQAQSVILHELAHIKRNDYFINLIQSVIELILFFNPFIKLLSNTIKRERENCCDDWVVNFKYNKQQYASALLILEEQRRNAVQLAMAATNDKHQLLARIKRIFIATPTVGIQALQQIKLATLSLLILAGILLISPGTKKTVIAETVANTAIQTKSNQQSLSNTETIKSEKIVNELPIKTAIVKNNSVKSKPEIDNKQHNSAVDYTVAFINDDLLKGKKDIIYSAITASNKETTAPVMMTIEEQQSGTDEKKIYIFQLNNDNGNPEIKPMIIINKGKVEFKNGVSKKIQKKKRITS